MDRPRALRLLCCLGLLAAGLTPAAVAAPAPKVNARKLVRMAEDAWSRTAQAAQGASRNSALWMSLDRMHASLLDVDTTLRQRDLAFFRALRSGSVAMAQLGVVWSQSGIKDSAIDREIRTLSASYRQLRSRYGPEWVRFRTGKPLNEKERQRFERMRAEQARLAGRLEPLRDKAAAAGDKATAGQLAVLIAQAQSIATAPLTLDELLEASVLSDAIRGEWYGTRAVHPTAQEDWVQADDAVEELYTDESVGFVFTAELGSGTVQGWSFTEEETDLTEEIDREEVAQQPAEIQAGDVLLFDDGQQAPEVFEEGELVDDEGGAVAFEEMAPEGEEVAAVEAVEPAEPGEPEAVPEDAGEAAPQGDEEALPELLPLEALDTVSPCAAESAEPNETCHEGETATATPPSPPPPGLHP
jgi:hypothetical protein